MAAPVQLRKKHGDSASEDLEYELCDVAPPARLAFKPYQTSAQLLRSDQLLRVFAGEAAFMQTASAFDAAEGGVQDLFRRIQSERQLAGSRQVRA